MAKHSWLWTPLALVVLAGGSYLIYRALAPPELPDGILYGNGHIEGTEVTVASEATGRVIASNLIEGGTVGAGGVLVRLDDTDLETQLSRAQAQQQLAIAKRQRLTADVATARHHLANAEIDAQRAAALARKGAMSVARSEQYSNLLAEGRSHVATLSDAIAASIARVRAAE